MIKKFVGINTKKFTEKEWIMYHNPQFNDSDFFNLNEQNKKDLIIESYKDKKRFDVILLEYEPEIGDVVVNKKDVNYKLIVSDVTYLDNEAYIKVDNDEVWRHFEENYFFDKK